MENLGSSVFLILALAVALTHETKNILLGSLTNPSDLTNDIGSYRKCTIDGDMVVQPGTTWDEGCKKCRCDFVRGKVCEGHVACANPYKAWHKFKCNKWSSDKCCCEELGCQAPNGRFYSFGVEYTPWANPCFVCKCKEGFAAPECRIDLCPYITCVDPVRIKWECCKRCLKGPNCSIPPLDGIESSLTEGVTVLLKRYKIISSNITKRKYSCECKVPAREAICFEEVM